MVMDGLGSREVTKIAVSPAFRHGDKGVRCILFSFGGFDSRDWYYRGMEYKSNRNVVYSCKYHVCGAPSSGVRLDCWRGRTVKEILAR